MSADTRRYKIVRFYFKDHPKETGETNLSLEEAQAHCSKPSTRGNDPDKGPWFDGYELDND